jgi:hypothetical protein
MQGVIIVIALFILVNIELLNSQYKYNANEPIPYALMNCFLKPWFGNCCHGSEQFRTPNKPFAFDEQQFCIAECLQLTNRSRIEASVEVCRPDFNKKNGELRVYYHCSTA